MPEPTSPPACECLPSGDAALNLVRKPSAATAGYAVGTGLVRAGIVAGGLYVVGGLRGKELLKTSLIAAGSIELAIMLWASGK
jgi:hypothetical protein